MEDFLESRLPQETLQRIDMSSLRLTNKSFGTKKGKQKHSDLIYAVTIDGQEGYLYISLEHQSKEEKYMPLRQLEYNVLLMRQHLDEGHSTLPLILNICLYNGKQPYQGPVTLLELFVHPELAKKYIMEGYHLVDLRRDSMESIQKDKKAALAELILKQGISGDFCPWLDRFESLLSLLEGPYNEAVYMYMYTLDPHKKAILERIEKLKDPTQRQVAMTAAQYLKQQGRQEGMQQGMQQGIQQGMQQGMQTIARNMLAKMHLDIETVAQATGLSEQELIKLQEEGKERS